MDVVVCNKIEYPVIYILVGNVILIYCPTLVPPLYVVVIPDKAVPSLESKELTILRHLDPVDLSNASQGKEEAPKYELLDAVNPPDVLEVIATGLRSN